MLQLNTLSIDVLIFLQSRCLIPNIAIHISMLSANHSEVTRRNGGRGGGILKTEEKVSKLFHVYTIIMVSISTDARDGTSEIVI